jgi:hypothetical protein
MYILTDEDKLIKHKIIILHRILLPGTKNDQDISTSACNPTAYSSH